NFRSGVFTEKHAIVDFDIQWGDLAVLVKLAFADGDDLSFLWFFFCCVRNNESSLSFFLSLNPLNYDPILQRSNLHLWSPFTLVLLTDRFYTDLSGVNASPCATGLPRAR